MPYETDADGNIVANILPFATEAKTRLYEWQRMNTEECNREECDALKGVYNKFDPCHTLLSYTANGAVGLW